MSYAVSEALQEAVYQRLAADAPLAALVGGAIFDAVPAGDPPGTYVTLGPEEVQDRSDRTGAGAEHRLSVSVVTSEAGFRTAKSVAVAVSDSLHGSVFALARGRLVGLQFRRARARRVNRGDVRRIDLIFRARVEDD